MEYIALQLFNGLVNGSFYALLSLGLAVIFGVLRVVNFAHGALYMLGAFAAYLLLQDFGVGFWFALILAPIGIGIAGMVQDGVRLRYGLQGQPYPAPAELAGSVSAGLVAYPTYRLFVIAFSIVVCVAVWYVIERTRLGMIVRAATERPELTRALGINVDRWVTPVFGFGVALAALGGVLAAPMRNVSPLMGSELIIFAFAVVVIGGMGSIAGAVVAGFLVGILASLAAVFDPALENVLAFALMAVVLLVRPAGLFGSVDRT